MIPAADRSRTVTPTGRRNNLLALGPPGVGPGPVREGEEPGGSYPHFSHGLYLPPAGGGLPLSAVPAAAPFTVIP